MTIEEYLQSEEAAADVAALLAQPRDAIRAAERRAADAWWCVVGVEIDDRPSPWNRVDLAPGQTVYYRAEGDRFVVSDLGDAVRVYRLRTGWADPYIGDPMLRRLRACVPDEWDVEVGPDGQVYAISDKAPRGVLAADLPRAIVRVMLAAVRVAALEAR